MQKLKWPKSDKHLHIPMYGGSIYLYLDKEKFNQAVEYADIGDGADISTDGMVYNYISKDGGLIHLVGVFTEFDSVKIHELSHVTFSILEHVGINAIESEEAFCYLIQYLYEKLFESTKVK
jgi:hypothetical protein